MFRKIIFIALAALAVLSCKKDKYVPYGQDVVAFTGDYSDLTPYSVTLAGTVYTTSLMRELEMGIYLSEDPEPVSHNSTRHGEHDGRNTFSYNFDNLKPGTTYYYRTFLYCREGVNLERWEYGETKSFTSPSNDVSTTIDHVIAGVTSYYLSGSYSLEFDNSVRAQVYLITGGSRSAVENKSEDSNTLYAGYLGDRKDFKFEISGMGESGLYYRTYVTFEGREYYGEIYHVEPIAFAPTVGEAINMGLSVMWASSNVGAEYPEQWGNYYSWGETSTKGEYGTDNYTYPLDTPGNLPLSRDAAYVNLDGKWRMPTEDEASELLENTLHEFGEFRSVQGYLVVSKKNGNALFFPAAGYKAYTLYYEGGEGIYWTSSSAGIEDQSAYMFSFKCPKDRFGFRISGFTGSHWGCSIRPVRIDN